MVAAMASAVLLQTNFEGRRKERHTLVGIIRDLINILAMPGFMEAGA
jgi:hypothetical protein